MPPETPPGTPAQTSPQTSREPAFLDTPEGRRLAYHRTEGRGPGIVFLGGFSSDMDGTKAVHLDAWARARGRAFLRFDYSGHGRSSGAFADGCLGDWTDDAAAAIEALTRGPQILVGSSMGGWVALLLARRMPERIAGLVGIAAAPDFTEDDIDPSLTDAERAQMAETGRIERPSPYSDAPDIFTRRLLEDGRRNLVLRDPLHVPGRMRLLQGTADAEVPVALAVRLFDHADCADAHLCLVKGADHRFSTPECLSLIETAVQEASEPLFMIAAAP